MDLEAIINEVADEAGEILFGIFIRKDARTVLSDHFQTNYDKLLPDDRLVIIRGVMDILQKEYFSELILPIPNRSGDQVLTRLT
jgi:hypothetical protein